MLPEQEAQNLVPDAVAGAVKITEPQVFGVVIVEEAPEIELTTFSELVLSNMQLEDKQLREFENFQFREHKAVRSIVTGRAQGIPMCFGHVMFLHQEHAYQLIAWTPAAPEDYDPTLFQSFFNSFQILAGQVQQRAKTFVQRDVYGVGWRVVSGQFESTASGIAVRPSAPWRVVVGDELANMNPEAEVGLICSQPEVYLFIAPDIMTTSDREAYEALARRSAMENLGAEELHETYVATVAGQEVPFRRFRTRAPPMDYFHGVLYREERPLVIMFWCMSALRSRAEAVLPDGLAAIQWLPPEELQALTRRMQQARDPQFAVGRNFSLRGGVYRSFLHRYQWKKPDRFWTVRTGQDARRANSDAELYLKDAARGLYGVVIAEPAGFLPAEEFHHLVTSRVLKQTQSTTTLESGRATWRITEGLGDPRGLPMGYRIATTVAGGRAVQCIVWSAAENLARHAAAAEVVVRSFEFETDLQPIEQQEGRYIDHRLGFSLQPPPWPQRDLTPPQIAEIGTFVAWQQGGRIVGALSVAALATHQDEQRFVQFLHEILDQYVTSRTSQSPVVEDAELGGVPGRRVRWQLPREVVEATFVVRDGAAYCLILGGPDASWFDPVRRSFQILD